MKTLYESILDTVNAGKSKFSKNNITGYISSTNLKDIINMSKVRRALKDLYGDPFTNSYCDAQALAMLLTQFEYTKHEIDYLKQNGKEISDIFKAKLSDYLHKKNKDKFDFQTTVGPTGGTVHIVNADGEAINWRTVFYYNLNK